MSQTHPNPRTPSRRLLRGSTLTFSRSLGSVIEVAYLSGRTTTVNACVWAEAEAVNDVTCACCEGSHPVAQCPQLDDSAVDTAYADDAVTALGRTSAWSER